MGKHDPYAPLTDDEATSLAHQIQRGLAVQETVPKPDRRTPAEQQVVDDGEQAFRRFVTANLPLVTYVHTMLFGSSPRMDDVLQAGHIGLCVAARKYDPTTGYKFSTMAVPWISQQIRRERPFGSSSVVHISDERYAYEMPRMYGDSIYGEGATVDNPENYYRWGMFNPDQFEPELADGWEACLPSPPCPLASEDEVLVGLEPFGEMHNAVHQLPPELRDVVIGRIGVGVGDKKVSFRELAEHDDASEEVMRRRFPRALKLLSEEIRLASGTDVLDG